MMTASHKGILLGCLGALCTGFFIVFFKKASNLADARQMALVLFGFSGIIQLLFLTLTGKIGRLGSISRQEWYCAMAMAAGAIAGNLSSAAAITTMSAPLVTALVRFEVIFVSLVGFLAMNERLGIWFFVGVAIVACGMAYALPTSAIGTTNYEGLLYALLSACSFGVVTLSARYFRAGIDIAKVNLLRILMCFAFMLVVADLSFIGDGRWQPQYTYLAVCAFCGPFLARLFKMASSRFVPAGYTALTALLQPFFAFVIAMALIPLYEPAMTEVVGCVIMVSGIVVALAPKLGLGISEPTPQKENADAT